MTSKHDTFICNKCKGTLKWIRSAFEEVSKVMRSIPRNEHVFKMKNDDNTIIIKKMMKYDIFICYRRKGGSERAELLKAIFEKNGYTPNRIFMDTHTLKGGDFKIRLKEAINESNNFIVLITKSCFDDIKEGDFFIFEISEAILLNKNVIPVFFDGLNTTEMDNVPESIKSLSYKNAVSYSHEYADACYKKLCSFLVSDTKDFNLQESPKRPLKSLFKKPVYLLVAVLVTVILICGILLVPTNKGNGPSLSDNHQTKEQIIDNIQRSTILMLLSENTYATAFLVSEDGLALTANHVLNVKTLTDSTCAYVNGNYYSIKKLYVKTRNRILLYFS